ncbi:PREDICTED: uncharacterized protein LOC109229947 [Nicotiana attenuata]|uniref:uncharacterized protein LOC109229947 n=1 Tax=Nicotiana attenuata TaxID=49451 RepID=UPI00090481D3|nr:PREDICTED: uncharacterized protein LOC109229947 [Nicotiana attenuata]
MDRKFQFDFIALMEPKKQIRTVDQYRRRLGFEQVVVNVSNKIWLFIDQKYDFDILFNMEQQITLKMLDIDSKKEIIITMVYAKCNAIERIELWDTLYSLASDMSLSWLVGGDFNVIWDEEEKFGGFPAVFSPGGMGELRKNAYLNDLTDVWEIWNYKNYGQIKHEAFLDVVKENWQADFHASPFILFNYKMKKLEQALSTWSKATFGDIFKQIASLEEVVKVHETQFELNPTIQNRERLHRVKADLIRVLALEEEFWKQKASLNWFKDGDRNSKLFHAHVKGKRKRLQLKRIQDRYGVWIEDEEKIAEEAVHFFQQQFHEDSVPTDFRILDHAYNDM